MNEEHRPFSQMLKESKQTLMPISGSFTPRELLAYGVRSVICLFWLA